MGRHATALLAAGAPRCRQAHGREWVAAWCGLAGETRRGLRVDRVRLAVARADDHAVGIGLARAIASGDHRGCEPCTLRRTVPAPPGDGRALLRLRILARAPVACR